MNGRQISHRLATEIPQNQATAAAPARRWLVIILLLTTLLPMQFYVGPLFMTPSRTILLCTTPVLLILLLMGRYGRITLFDGLIFFNVFWLILSVTLNNPEVALTYTGSNALVILGGYLIGRVAVRSAEDFARLSNYIAIAVVISLPFALAEARTGVMYVARFVDALPAITGIADVFYDPRLGIHRVQFVFPHPIHYGLFCSMAISLVFIGQRGLMNSGLRLLAAAIILLCCFLSVSSGPFLSAIAQILLILYMKIFYGLSKKWVILLWVILLLYVVAEVVSNRPAIYSIVSALAFAPHTANVRRILFEYGFAQILIRPIFGVGFNPWDRPLPHFMSGSLDNFWLLLALVYGLPAFFSLFGAIVYSIIRISRRPVMKDSPTDNARHAWIFTVISLTLTLATVAIWNEIMSLFYMIIGSGVWLLEAKDDEPKEKASVGPAVEKRGPVYTRFPRVVRET